MGCYGAWARGAHAAIGEGGDVVAVVDAAHPDHVHLIPRVVRGVEFWALGLAQSNCV